MKLTADEISFIVNCVKTCRLVGIDKFIIEPGRIRGMYENLVFLLHTDDVPDMPFGSIGMTRLDTFLARYEIAKTQDNFSVEASLNKDGDAAYSLLMKGKGIKIDYKCGAPGRIRAPKQLPDELEVEASINAEAVLLLQKGQAAMEDENVTIISNDEGVSFEIIDLNNNDVLRHSFADSATALTDEGKTTFAHRYPIKILLAMFKQNPNGTFKVSSKGILTFPVNDLSVFLLPQV